MLLNEYQIKVHVVTIHETCTGLRSSYVRMESSDLITCSSMLKPFQITFRIGNISADRISNS